MKSRDWLKVSALLKIGDCLKSEECLKDDDWLKSGGSISMWPEAGSLADPYLAENLG